MKLSRILDNIEIKLICLLLAVVLWLYASNPKGTETLEKLMKTVSRSEDGLITFTKLPIRLTGVEKKWKAEPNRILLEVKCLSANIDLDNFQVVVKLKQSDEDKTDGKISLTEDNVILPKGLIFLRTDPKEVKIVSVP